MSNNTTVAVGAFNLLDLVLFELTSAELIISLLAQYLESFLGLAANSLLIAVIIKTKEFHTIGYEFMAHLALGEMIQSVCYATGISTSLYAYLYPNTIFIRWQMDLLAVFFVFGYNLSVFLMLFISINRFFSVVYYATYRQIFTPTRARILILIAYFNSFWGIFPQIPMVNLSSYAWLPRLWTFALDDSPSYPWAGTLFVIFQCVAVALVIAMVVLYTSIFIKLRALRKAREATARAGNTASTSSRPKKEDVQLTIQFFIVSMIFVAMWVVTAVYVQGMASFTTSDDIKILTIVKNVVVNMNCNVNPFIYMIINRRLRHHIFTLATCGRTNKQQVQPDQSATGTSRQMVVNSTNATANTAT